MLGWSSDRAGPGNRRTGVGESTEMAGSVLRNEITGCGSAARDHLERPSNPARDRPALGSRPARWHLLEEENSGAPGCVASSPGPFRILVGPFESAALADTPPGNPAIEALATAGPWGRFWRSAETRGVAGLI